MAAFLTRRRTARACAAPVGKLLGPSAGLISDVSKAAGAPIGGLAGDAITDSQVAKQRSASCRSRAMWGCGRRSIC